MCIDVWYLTHRNSINAVNFMIWLDALRHIHTIFTCQPITDPCLLWCRHNPRAANHLKQCMLRQHHGYHPQRQSLSRPLWLSVLTLNPSLIFLFLAKNSLFRVSADEQTKASQLPGRCSHASATNNPNASGLCRGGRNLVADETAALLVDGGCDLLIMKLLLTILWKG